MELAEITHQTQPTPYTCVHTCLAMILGEPVQKVIDVFGAEYGMSDREIDAAMDKCRLLWNRFVYPDMIVPGYYIIGVPSLNIAGGTHCIIVRRDEDGRMKVFDPNRGVEGKKVYDENGKDLHTWFNVVLVYPGGKLPASK